MREREREVEACGRMKGKYHPHPCFKPYVYVLGVHMHMGVSLPGKGPIHDQLLQATMHSHAELQN